MIYEARLQRNFVVQVILNDKTTSSSQPINTTVIPVEDQPITAVSTT